MERAFRLCPVSNEMFRALTFREILAAERTAILREFNQCHNPEGPAGGRFCSGEGSGVTLPEHPDRYFVRDAKTSMVRLDHVDTIRARPEGIANAEPLMRKAYDGEGTRRAPVTLQEQPGGRYRVLDGNSTVAIARKHGWKSIPAHVLRTPEELASFHQAEAAKKAAKAAKKAAHAAA